MKHPVRSLARLSRAIFSFVIGGSLNAQTEPRGAESVSSLTWSALLANELKAVTSYVARLAVESGGPLLRQIPRGHFIRSNPNAGYLPSHRVIIPRAFFLGATEVTQAQWMTVMSDNPSSFVGANLPVENVSWDDAMAFCKKLNERERAAGRLPTHWEFTLPTEAQWEFACRAGTTGEYAGNLGELGWCVSDSGGETHAVGTKLPNAWGLSDMHGNVWEWCLDYYADYPVDQPIVFDPVGPSDPQPARGSAGRVIRGGSFETQPTACRSRYRAASPQQRRQGFSSATVKTGNFGFRLALVSLR